MTAVLTPSQYAVLGRLAARSGPLNQDLSWHRLLGPALLAGYVLVDRGLAREIGGYFRLEPAGEEYLLHRPTATDYDAQLPA